MQDNVPINPAASDPTHDDTEEDLDPDTKIMFLYQLIRGPASRSYGLNVARLAGYELLWITSENMFLVDTIIVQAMFDFLASFYYGR